MVVMSVQIVAILVLAAHRKASLDSKSESLDSALYPPGLRSPA
jgi:hypothetical protein